MHKVGLTADSTTAARDEFNFEGGNNTEDVYTYTQVTQCFDKAANHRRQLAHPQVGPRAAYAPPTQTIREEQRAWRESRPVVM